MKLPELLSPAGSYEKMLAAFRYGADAVYLAGEDFGMRSAAQNFSLDEIRRAVRYARAAGKRVYVTVNILPHSDEYPALRCFLRALAKEPPDALIISDLGVIEAARELIPASEIHLSTQASAVSAAACRAWHRLGVKRVVLARELTLSEIAFIRRTTARCASPTAGAAFSPSTSRDATRTAAPARSPAAGTLSSPRKST